MPVMKRNTKATCMTDKERTCKYCKVTQLIGSIIIDKEINISYFICNKCGEVNKNKR